MIVESPKPEDPFGPAVAAEPEDTLYNWHVWMSILLSASVLPPPRPARGRPLGAGR